MEGELLSLSGTGTHLNICEYLDFPAPRQRHSQLNRLRVE